MAEYVPSSRENKAFFQDEILLFVEAPLSWLLWQIPCMAEEAEVHQQFKTVTPDVTDVLPFGNEQ